MKKALITFALAAALLVPCFSQESSRASDAQAQGKAILDDALSYFSKNDYRNALVLLRKIIMNPAYADSIPDAYYWSILSNIALQEYDSAGKDIEYFIANFQNNPKYPDVLYQQGRQLFLKESYEKSLQTFQSFLSTYPRNELYSSALFWAGECMYRLGQFADAVKAYTALIEKYPDSVKRDASEYRLDLIEQKYREAELLKLLKWSHEESLKSIEEFQRREKSYEQAINGFQKKIADMLKDTRLADLEARVAELEKQNADLTRKVNEKDASIESLTKQLQASAAVASTAQQEAKKTQEQLQSQQTAAIQTSAGSAQELLKMKAKALDLKEFYIEWLSKNGGSR
jgi:TolA-binding protein